MQLLDKAAAIDDGYALIAYRQAECLAAAGEREQALALYRRARDLDGCRFRAPSSFREIIRQVATDANRTSCYYLDLDEVLASLSQRAAPGNDFFYEHVHFNFDGHREVARAIAQSIVEQVEGQEWNEDWCRLTRKSSAQTGLTTFDHLMALGYVLKIVHEQPFGSAPDEQRQYTFLAEKFQGYMRTLPAPDQDHVWGTGYRIEADGHDQRHGCQAARPRRDSARLALFRTAQLRRPWEITPMWASRNASPLSETAARHVPRSSRH